MRNYKFYPDYEDVLNHIKNSNPHEKGSPRDALTHGISNVEDYLWTKEVEIPISSFSNLNPWGISARNLKKYRSLIKKGKMPPAVIAVIGRDYKIRLLDGSHRIEALLNEGYDSVKVYIGVLPEDLEFLTEEYG